jgi:rhamnosyltransferase
VAFADQDDIWYADKLARGCEAMRVQRSDAYSSNVLAFWPDGHEVLVEKHQPQVRFDFLFEAAGPGCTYVFSSALACEFKSFLLAHWQEIQDVSLHDWLLYAYARSHGKRWYIDPQPSMRYRQHASNQVGVNTGMSAKKARLRQVLSGWWLHQSLRIARLMGMQNSAFVSSWSALNARSLVRLAGASSQCRRRSRDKFYFFGLCLVLMVAALAGRKNA